MDHAKSGMRKMADTSVVFGYMLPWLIIRRIATPIVIRPLRYFLSLNSKAELVASVVIRRNSVWSRYNMPGAAYGLGSTAAGNEDFSPLSLRCSASAR